VPRYNFVQLPNKHNVSINIMQAIVNKDLCNYNLIIIYVFYMECFFYV